MTAGIGHNWNWAADAVTSGHLGPMARTPAHLCLVSDAEGRVTDCAMMRCVSTSPTRLAAEERSAPSAGRVQSVDRALQLLDRVASAGPRGETGAALAEQCGINRATAWRLLATLEDRGLVERDQLSNRYRVGFTLVRLSAAAGVDGLVRRTHHILERVSAQTGETADLAIAGRHGLSYVDEVAPSTVLSLSWLGREVPLHATSTGKALLAWLPPGEVRSLLATPLPGYTDATITDPAQLRVELAETRARGYAVCPGELEATLFGVSAPVLDDRQQRPYGVFSIWGPVSRVPRRRFDTLGPLAVQAAAAVADVMAGRRERAS